MKSFKSIFTRTVCLLTLAIASNSFTYSQEPAKPKYAAGKTAVSDIRFVRTEGDMLVFDLLLSNLPAKGTMLRISDGENNIILEEKISTETYNIRYKIARENIKRINFEISGKKVFLKQSFTIGSRVEEKIEVTKTV
ncbi:MAG: hypothetical protein IPP96_13720 [Chitinophagaceae bacterium]|nr:hypothetical protein [Chitinophagaceae bacterium]